MQMLNSNKMISNDWCFGANHVDASIPAQLSFGGAFERGEDYPPGT